MDTSKEIILEENMNENDLPKIKNYKKIKYSIAIIASTLIIAAVITLSIGHFKVEIIEEEIKPAVRNLQFYRPTSRKCNLGSFKVGEQTVSIIHYNTRLSDKFINEISINSALGHFKFGMSGESYRNGSKSYMVPIFKITLPQIPNYLVTGYAKGSLSWDYSLTSTNKKRYGLSGALNLYVEMTPLSETNVKVTCEGKGTLAEIKGGIILNDKNSLFFNDSEFSLGMGNLKIIFHGSIFPDNIYTMTLFEGWRSLGKK